VDKFWNRKERKCKNRKEAVGKISIGKRYQWSNCRIERKTFAGI
jgi:hypothetical protein